MKENGYKGEMDYERIEIYPLDYTKEKREKLYRILKNLGIKFEYEYY